MRPRENYNRFILAGMLLTLAILILFQVYSIKEPGRIENALSADLSMAIEEGRALFAENCTECHGQAGEGGFGPALNSRELLKSTDDEVISGIMRTGIPGSSMPAWGQAHGGPFTDEQIRQLTTFIRAWEPEAPLILTEVREPDAVAGATIFASSCFTCHGENGEGTEIAPAINDPSKLATFDDNWYRATIANGRPAAGMPTWGTVISPAQINDLVALIDAWRRGEVVQPGFTALNHVRSALFAVRQFDRLDALYFLSAALPLATREQADQIGVLIDMVRENRLFEAEGTLVSMFPPEEMGKELFSSNCTSCHGDDGTGVTGPNLHTNAFIQSRTDEELVKFILQGRRGTAMDGFDGILPAEDVINLIALLRTWQASN